MNSRRLLDPPERIPFLVDFDVVIELRCVVVPKGILSGRHDITELVRYSFNAKGIGMASLQRFGETNEDGETISWHLAGCELLNPEMESDVRRVCRSIVRRIRTAPKCVVFP